MFKKKDIKQQVNDLVIESFVKKVFNEMEHKANIREGELEKKEIVLNNKEKELNNIENADIRNSAEINTRYKQICEEYETAVRKTTKSLDPFDVESKELNSYKKALLWALKKQY